MENELCPACNHAPFEFADKLLGDYVQCKTANCMLFGICIDRARWNTRASAPATDVSTESVSSSSATEADQLIALLE